MSDSHTEPEQKPGAIDFGDVLRSLGRYVSPVKLAKAGAELGIENLKILAGRSNVEIDTRDPRFRDPAWTENPLYERLGKSYFAFCAALDEMTSDDSSNWRASQRAKFATELLTSTLAPTNMLLGNPSAMKRLFDTGGKSIVDGGKNMLHDFRHNGGMPSQYEKGSFTVGKDLAATPGAVVFRNENLEILQYAPTTKKVYSIPVLIMTPQINKYYFLDLSPGRSFVEYLASQGMQPFMVSWKNPTAAEGHWDLDTYCEALSEAVDAVCDISGVEKINTFGFCAGGITMSAMLAAQADSGKDRINAISYAVTLLDFSTASLIGILQSDRLLKLAKSRSHKRGVLDGAALGSLFSWFRPNDLIWNYWVNNYLHGKPPPRFDILAWNADPTNLPGALHADFLDIFGKNALATPGGFKAMGRPVDLRKITHDAFITGATNDHLTPWTGCYRTTQLLGGKTEFVLSHAGHIASLVNPPGNPKSSYFTGPEPGPDHDKWRELAKKHQGSWWEYWIKWASTRSGEKRAAAKTLGSKKYPPIVDAPGKYIYE